MEGEDNASGVQCVESKARGIVRVRIHPRKYYQHPLLSYPYRAWCLVERMFTVEMCEPIVSQYIDLFVSNI